MNKSRWPKAKKSRVLTPVEWDMHEKSLQDFDVMPGLQDLADKYLIEETLKQEQAAIFPQFERWEDECLKEF